VARKDYKKAIALYRDRVSKQPKNSSLRLALADTLLMANQQDDAIREYKESGVLYTEEGFLVKAIAVYKKILKLRPGDRDIETFLEHLSDRRGMNAPRAKLAAPPPQEPPAPAHAKPAAIPMPPPQPIMRKPEETPLPRSPARQPFLEIETRLFRGLAPEEFRGIVSKLTLRHYDEDTIVVQEGDPGDSFFIVVQGQVRVLTHDTRNKEILLANLGDGEFFGEVSLLTGRPRTATIITNLNSELFELTRRDYEALISLYPHVKVVMEEFHQQRAYKTIDAMIQSMRENP
ncbi:MAG TPA: cyclic nucleotide-binding domain-containing protein, partial [Acidobacteriota bacterium]|nr:cyclic nucleotide-binding domain-containing protein [Acidobacteriota bacterium]